MRQAAMKNNDAIEPSEILVPPLKGEKQTALHPNPWNRFLARMMDYSIFGMVFLFLGYWLSPRFFLKEYKFFVPFLFALWIPCEALFLKYFGRTPGKFLLGLKVIKSGRKAIDYKTAIKRSFLVWVRGIALGIPIINIIAMLYAFFQLKTHKDSSWDRDEHTKIVAVPIHPARPIIAALIIVSYVILDQFVLR